MQLEGDLTPCGCLMLGNTNTGWALEQPEHANCNGVHRLHDSSLSENMAYTCGATRMNAVLCTAFSKTRGSSPRTCTPSRAATHDALPTAYTPAAQQVQGAHLQPCVAVDQRPWDHQGDAQAGQHALALQGQLALGEGTALDPQPPVEGASRRVVPGVVSGKCARRMWAQGRGVGNTRG
jgi:hypothetical protein